MHGRWNCRQTAKRSEREPGCKDFDVGLDAESPEPGILHELLGNRDAFDVHAASVHLQSFPGFP